MSKLRLGPIPISIFDNDEVHDRIDRNCPAGVQVEARADDLIYWVFENEYEGHLFKLKWL